MERRRRRRHPLYYRIQMEDIIKLKFEQCLKHTEQRSYGGKKSVRFLNSSFFKTEQDLPPKHSKGGRSSAHLKRVNSKWNAFYS